MFVGNKLPVGPFQSRPTCITRDDSSQNKMWSVNIRNVTFLESIVGSDYYPVTISSDE